MKFSEFSESIKKGGAEMGGGDIRGMNLSPEQETEIDRLRDIAKGTFIVHVSPYVVDALGEAATQEGETFSEFASHILADWALERCSNQPA